MQQNKKGNADQFISYLGLKNMKEISKDGSSWMEKVRDKVKDYQQ